MKPTGILREEHQLILLMLKIVEAVCSRLDKGEAVDTAHLSSIIDFIRNFADGCHYAKEEKLLFLALEKAGMPQNDVPIAVMLRKHTLGRNYGKGMDYALQSIKNGDKEAARIFTENARGYIQLLWAHIDKERPRPFRYGRSAFEFSGTGRTSGGVRPRGTRGNRRRDSCKISRPAP